MESKSLFGNFLALLKLHSIDSFGKSERRNTAARNQKYFVCLPRKIVCVHMSFILAIIIDQSWATHQNKIKKNKRIFTFVCLNYQLSLFKILLPFYDDDDDDDGNEIESEWCLFRVFHTCFSGGDLLFSA